MTKQSSLHHHRNGQAAFAGAFTESVTPANAGNSQDRFATQSYQAANLAALNDGVWDTGNAAFADTAADDEAEYDPHKDLVCYDTDDEPMEESDLTDSRLRAGDDWGRHRLYVNPLSNGHQQAPGYPDGVLLATHRDGRTVPYVHNTTLRPFDCGFFVHADFMANSAVLGISAEGFMFELGCREANLLHSGSELFRELSNSPTGVYGLGFRGLSKPSASELCTFHRRTDVGHMLKFRLTQQNGVRVDTVQLFLELINIRFELIDLGKISDEQLDRLYTLCLYLQYRPLIARLRVSVLARLEAHRLLWFARMDRDDKEMLGRGLFLVADRLREMYQGQSRGTGRGIHRDDQGVRVGYRSVPSAQIGTRQADEAWQDYWNTVAMDLTELPPGWVTTILMMVLMDKDWHMQGGHVGESRGNLFPDERSLVEMVKRFSARRTKRFDSTFELREL